MSVISIAQSDLLEFFVEEKRRIALAAQLQPQPQSQSHEQGDPPSSSFSTSQEDILKTVYVLLPNYSKLIEASLEILDSSSESIKPVVEFEDDSASKRKFWKVIRARDREYLCFHNFCSCPSYAQLAKSMAEGRVLCKHLLAVKLGVALQMTEKRRLTTAQFVDCMVAAASSQFPQ